MDKLGSIPEGSPVTLTTVKETIFEATYRGYNPRLERYEFGITILPGSSATTVLFDRKSIKDVTLVDEESNVYTVGQN